MLLFETTVMAGTPVFNMADNCLQYCKIDKVEAYSTPLPTIFSKR